ncbi:MAG: phosphoribosyltransferase [Isosphaeraceae bacterium]
MKNTSQMKVIVARRALFHKCVLLGKRIAEDYGNEPFTIAWVRDGATVVIGDLIRSIKATKLRLTSLRAKSYKGMESTGKVEIWADGLKDEAIRGRRVLIVDDILDTGRTLVAIQEYIGKLGPAEIKTCVLLRKPASVLLPIEPNYVGFDIPNVFVVGYGLDYRDRFRELRYIAELDEKTKRKVDREEDGY